MGTWNVRDCLGDRADGLIGVMGLQGYKAYKLEDGLRGESLTPQNQ